MKSCIIFDFDCTITYSHVYWLVHNFNYYMTKWGQYLPVSQTDLLTIQSIITNRTPFDTLSENIKSNICLITYGGEQRLSHIKHMLEYFREKGYYIYISSNNKCSFINYLLQNFDLKKYFLFVHSIKNMLSFQNKKLFILDIQKTNQFNNVYYVDDTDAESDILNYEFTDGLINYKYFGKNIGLDKDMFGLTCDMIDELKKQTYLITHNSSLQLL